MYHLVQVLLTLPVNWGALRESGLANTVYKGGVLSHPNRGVKTLAETLCKQWSEAAPNKNPRCACTLVKCSRPLQLVHSSFAQLMKVLNFCLRHACHEETQLCT